MTRSSQFDHTYAAGARDELKWGAGKNYKQWKKGKTWATSTLTEHLTSISIFAFSNIGFVKHDIFYLSIQRVNNRQGFNLDSAL